MSNTSNALTIGQVADTIGVSTHTLRYYEQAGLIRAVGRTQAGHRLYSPADLDWLRFLMRLKATGMPIAGMQAFAALRAEGQQTFGARRDLLVAHRDAVLARIADLQANLGAIVDKIAYYEGEAAGKTSAAESQARRIDDTSSFSHSEKEKDSPWTTRKTSVTRKAGTN
ncbi:MerR family transcriptional regulator [Paraburkholderia caledonica]|uniref:DNA-binding transcriptional MerR regulator n=1 Tax=Paraburkholderia caledonica TaxID=134536 RepID=A0ABU1KSB9_9BURK|nr:MerR family transcriptional regulator [Paraburkholderia caledonica]MDR6373836.1 DNA-binding transcriptional MerR regulator [Paraburkholderia caledonica]